MDYTLTLIAFVLIYFLPFIVAMIRGKANAGAIGLLNLILGWTVLGWIGALIWACTAGGLKPAKTTGA